MGSNVLPPPVPPNPKRQRREGCTPLSKPLSLKEQFEDEIVAAVLKYAEADGRRILLCKDPAQVSYVMWDICCLINGGSSSNPYLKQERLRGLKDEGFRLISPFLKTFFSRWTENDPELNPLWENQYMFYPSTTAKGVCQWVEFYSAHFCN